ncbi:MAG: esterase/lipase family protein [Microthrixaceae bacterium]
MLVHGALINRSFFQTLSPLLANEGYCVFSLTWGSLGDPTVGGLAPIGQGARELADFVDDVLALTGSSEVDLVGHSEGTLMPQYYLKRLGGAGKVGTFVALASMFRGTRLVGADQFLPALMELPFGMGDWLRAAYTSMCGACLQVLWGSPFLEELNRDGVATPGVKYVSVVTRNDEFVVPYTSGVIDEPGAIDVVVQEGCPADGSDHASIAYERRAMVVVLNALDPAHATDPPCDLALPVWGTLFAQPDPIPH